MKDKVKNAIKLTTDIYLEKHLPKIPDDKKQIVINAYENDIDRIVNFVLESWFFDEKYELSELFIKWLHKNFYPQNFIQKGIDENGKEIIWLIPWEYKKIDNFANTKEIAKYFSDLPNWTEEKHQYINKELVPEKMKNTIFEFNKNFNNSENLQTKKDLVFLIVIDLVQIHPFSDWNWRIAGILLDLYLIKLWFSPTWLKTLASNNKLELDRAIYMTCEFRDVKYIYDFMEKIGGMI